VPLQGDNRLSEDTGAGRAELDSQETGLTAMQDGTVPGNYDVLRDVREPRPEIEDRNGFEGIERAFSWHGFGRTIWMCPTCRVEYSVPAGMSDMECGNILCRNMAAAREAKREATMEPDRAVVDGSAGV
jgi:hypothetical protein